jgi:stage III sporulation protein AG
MKRDMPIFKKIGELFSNKKGTWIIVAIGIVGMLLILLSEFLPRSDASDKKTSSAPPGVQTAAQTDVDYTQKMEARLREIVASISGVGQSKIMVTLENSEENVYAQEEKKDVNRTQDTQSGGTTRTQERDNTEQKYLVMQDKNGQEQPLVKTQLEPKVKGVVIVCEGADDLYVQEQVINAVKTAFDIPSSRICITKLAS